RVARWIRRSLSCYPHARQGRRGAARNARASARAGQLSSVDPDGSRSGRPCVDWKFVRDSALKRARERAQGLGGIQLASVAPGREQRFGQRLEPRDELGGELLAVGG